MEQPDMKEAALWYARAGIKVFPLHSIRDGGCTCGSKNCTAQGKHPIIRGWQADATNDEQTVSAWWAKYPWANIGIPTGEVNGFDVMDIDPRNGGNYTLEMLEAKHGDIKETWVARTGGGGEHIFYKHPSAPLASGTNKLGNGVDVKANGGYVVGAPGIHKSGGRYEWLGDYGPHQIALAPWPQSILAVLINGKRQALPKKTAGKKLSPDKIEEISQALVWIDPTDRDTWLHIGMALYNECPTEQGFAIWDTWSQRATDKYVAQDQSRVWNSFHQRDDGITLGTLVAMAKANGWQRQKRQEPSDRGEQATGLDSSGWDLITVDGKGGERVIKPFSHNLIQILSHDPRWKDTLAMNLFSNRILITKEPPIRIVENQMEWMRSYSVQAKAWLEKNWFKAHVNTDAVTESVEVVASFNSHHPVREWLNNLPSWDGKERLKLFFPLAFNADPDDYSAAVGVYLFCSAVNRIRNPGSQVDMMVVLEGKQGIGKSSAIMVIPPNLDWYSDLNESPESKDFYQALPGKWICEIGELHSFTSTKAGTDAVKRAITCRTDRYRPSYGDKSLDFPRQCIFMGTTNRDDWNKDPTGARRFLPILARFADGKWIADNREQLFAEAKVRLVNDPEWWNVPAEAAREAQDERFDSDPWEEDVQAAISGKPEVVVTDLLKVTIGISLKDITQHHKSRVGNILKRLGYVQKVRKDELRRSYKVFVRDD